MYSYYYYDGVIDYKYANVPYFPCCAFKNRIHFILIFCDDRGPLSNGRKLHIFTIQVVAAILLF